MHSGLDGFDVVVIGGGNAGMCAALEASGHGARVVVLESAPREFRGGNSRHTRNLRCMHDGPNDVLHDSYCEQEYLDDIVRVTGGQTNKAMARMVVRESADCPRWMKQFGVRFQPSIKGTLHLDRTNAFFLGGGKALLNRYYSAGQRHGIRVAYDAEVVELDVVDGRFRGLSAIVNGHATRISGKAVVLASGGFEANLDWLREVWGAPADNFIIRGTPYNKGKVLKLILERGAQPTGDATQCHAVAVDARAPKFDGGIVTRLDCLPLGIVVNKHAQRFYDEGQDFWPKRYAIWGRLVAGQPDQIAYAIVDSKAHGQFMPSVFPPHTAGSISELAIKLGLAPEKFEATVTIYNRAVRPGTFDSAMLDDCRTEGLSPEKSHWARAIDTPPFCGYPLRPGITFTYLGVKANEQARVMMTSGQPAANIFAAGEIMAGNILGQGYVAGIGMTIGTVFGRIAGREAAGNARG